MLKSESIAFGTKVQTNERHIDDMFNIPVNRGLSIQVAGDAFMRGFGRETSSRVF